jgi:hypothetical protein
MDVERILDRPDHLQTERELLEMVLSNRVDYFFGDEVGAAITVKNFSLLAEDLFKWRESTCIALLNEDWDEQSRPQINPVEE